MSVHFHVAFTQILSFPIQNKTVVTALVPGSVHKNSMLTAVIFLNIKIVSFCSSCFFHLHGKAFQLVRTFVIIIVIT